VRILANENFPRGAVDALQSAGHDVVWIRTESPGIADEEVLARAMAEQRVVFTFDKDFGELAYRVGLPSVCGVVLFRIRMDSPDQVAERVVNLIASRMDWVGHFSVIDDSKIRIRALPGSEPTDANP
jgi:predicted nuclease of predicted toxin-antitoxin system